MYRTTHRLIKSDQPTKTMNMIIGRDPEITMWIIRRIHERDQKAQKRKAVINRIKKYFGYGVI